MTSYPVPQHSCGWNSLYHGDISLPLVQGIKPKITMKFETWSKAKIQLIAVS